MDFESFELMFGCCIGARSHLVDKLRMPRMPHQREGVLNRNIHILAMNYLLVKRLIVDKI